MSPFAIVTARGPITVHSLRVGEEMTVLYDALAHGTPVLPGDVTSLVSGLVVIDVGSAINDPAGRAALAGLTPISPAATFALTASWIMRAYECR